MDIYDAIIYNVGMLLALGNQTISTWMVMPANATSPLDPSITLTQEGLTVVVEIADAAVGIGAMMAEACARLFW